jgi:MFS family permease
MRLTTLSLPSTDTFLASFIVPILPYILEGRVGLDPSQTQTMTSWLLAGNAAVSVLIRMPLAHFADQSTSRRGWFIWGLGLAFVSTIATAFGSSCMSKVSRSIGEKRNS